MHVVLPVDPSLRDAPADAVAGTVSDATREVASADELWAVLAEPGPCRILVRSNIAGLAAFRLEPGKAVVGAAGAALEFAAGQDGVCLTTDNAVSSLRLSTDPDRRAVWNDADVETLGCLTLRELTIRGAVRILVEGAIRRGHVCVDGLHLTEADARGFDERPAGFGVEVVPGAFTLWNRQSDPAVVITSDIVGISAGSPGRPVRGGGVFVAGAGTSGGRLAVMRLHTGAVHSDGGIAPGTPDRIAGGVFTVSGAVVEEVRNLGPVATYGANDMVLDNWGIVSSWVAKRAATSFGPSAIGFVNFGTLTTLRVEGPIETFGQGSRGFNVYDGVVHSAEFDRVVTHGDGAVGIQLSKPVGTIVVRHGVETFGGPGDSLVKGVVTRLPAAALSIKPGGSARRIAIARGLRSHGDGIEALELRGAVDELAVEAGSPWPAAASLACDQSDPTTFAHLRRVRCRPSTTRPAPVRSPSTSCSNGSVSPTRRFGLTSTIPPTAGSTRRARCRRSIMGAPRR